VKSPPSNTFLLPLLFFPLPDATAAALEAGLGWTSPFVLGTTLHIQAKVQAGAAADDGMVYCIDIHRWMDGRALGLFLPFLPPRKCRGALALEVDDLLHRSVLVCMRVRRELELDF